MGNTGTKIRSKKNERVVRVSKLDGKTLEFRSPVIIKDLLTSHPNCYVGVFKEATQPLPPNYKLKVGKMYYLLPLVDKLDDCNTRKIKVIITKHQFHMLMATQASLKDLSGSKMSRVMDAIPEEVESSSLVEES